MKLASCEKIAIFTGLGSLRCQITDSSSAVCNSFNDDVPSKSSSADPHDSVGECRHSPEILQVPCNDHYSALAKCSKL